MFNAVDFIATFPKTLKKLKASEIITKDTLQVLSRDLLSCLHTVNVKQGDIAFINQVIGVLTPVNRKVFLAFCKEFTGFILNDDGTAFIKKSKKHYDDVAATAIEWLNDPMNNIWSWADRHIDVEKKPNPFTLDVVKKSLEKLVVKGQKANISKAQIIGAMFASGFTVEDLIESLEQVHLVGDVVNKLNQEYEFVEQEPALM
jgi:hypothetical protein